MTPYGDDGIAARIALECEREAFAEAERSAGRRGAFALACESEPPTLTRDQWQARLRELAESREALDPARPATTHCLLCGEALPSSRKGQRYCRQRDNPKCARKRWSKRKRAS